LKTQVGNTEELLPG